MSASGFPSIHVEAYITSVWFAELGDVRMYLREGNQCKKSPLKKLNGSILLDEMSLRLDSYYEFYFQGTLLCTSSELYSYSQLCRETLFMLYCSHWVLFTAGHFTCLSTVSPKNIHIQKRRKDTLHPWSTRACSSIFLASTIITSDLSCRDFLFILITLSFTYFDHLSTPEKKYHKKTWQRGSLNPGANRLLTVY